MSRQIHILCDDRPVIIHPYDSFCSQIYLIKEKDEKFVYLVNGTTRTLDMPKKKNAKHIQIIKNLPIEVTEILEENLSDLTVKRAIKQYCQMNEGRQES